MKAVRRKIAGYLSGTVLSFLLYGLIRFIWLTMRVTVIGKEIMPGLVARGEGFVGVSWHGRLLMLPFAYPGRSLHILISAHRDGESIAQIIKKFGFGLVRGSSKKRGSVAMREMVRLLRRNEDLGLTPDGPSGPAEQVKLGVALLARLSGKPVVPICFAASRAIRMRSWDRFLVPYPFSRGVFVVGEPLYCREDDDPELFRQRIETTLREVTERADAYLGERRT